MVRPCRTYGRRHGDVAVTIRELATDAQRAWAQAAQAQAEAAQAQAEAAQAQDEAARAQREARTCPMTGLPNYLAYLEEAEELRG